MNTELPTPEPPTPNWHHWLHRLLVCNPFFLCSAALLLFGVNRLSIDRDFLPDETQNLLFNFLALQAYEILLITAAVMLARRRAWYDAALLVVLESGLVLVPFMLISQASLIDGPLATLLGCLGGLAAAARVAAVRRFFPQFNLPRGALLLGGMILLANVALPRIFRLNIEADLEDWSMANQWLWLVLLPLLGAGANLLPRPSRYGGLNPERHWLPLFIYGLWIVGSAVHIWCLAHICGFPFRLGQLAPLAVVAGWTMFNRFVDCLPNPPLRAWQVMLALAWLAPLLAAGEPRLLVVLCGFNLIGFVALALTGPKAIRAFAGQLAMAAVALSIAGLPEEWGRALAPQFSRSYAVILGVTLFLIARALHSVRPEAGLLGAVAVGVDTLGIARTAPLDFAAQAACVFLLIHSLRWDDRQAAPGRIMRRIGAVVWLLHSLWWTRLPEAIPLSTVCAAAVSVLAGWLMAWAIRGKRGSALVVVSAVVALLCGPGNWLVRNGPVGLLALIGSLLLFAGGIILACTRPRWTHRVVAADDP